MSNKIKFTKGEAEALWDAAGNMKDELEDYFSFMPKAKLKKFISDYNTGMEKLNLIFKKKNQ